MSHPILNKRTTINGVEIFYREAGDAKNPSLLLLHGFPSSSLMFKNLMLSLSDKYHLVAPDYPGFGFSGFPSPDEFEYTFGNIASCLEQFIKQIGLDKFYIYLHDYGTTIALRICVNNPDKILGLIIQNANTYDEGMGQQWDEVKDYWANPTPEKEKSVKKFLTDYPAKNQYTDGLPEELLPYISPELYTLDEHLLQRPGNIDMQFSLNCDYQHNIPLFPAFQEYFSTYQPPALVMWGKYDVFYSIDEAYCYQRDLPGAQPHIINGGHFALETNFEEVLRLIKEFIGYDKTS